MKEYNASKGFLKFLKEHPEDFTVHRVSKESGVLYRVEHTVSKVSIAVLKYDDGSVSNIVECDSDIHQVSMVATRTIVKFAENRIYEKDQQQKTYYDNRLLEQIEQHYAK